MAKGNEKKHRKSVSYAKWAYIFITPFFISYILFTLIPQFLTVYNSFFENYRNGLEQVGPNFVGLRNYIQLLTPDKNGTIDFVRYLGNSLGMWIAGAIPQFLLHYSPWFMYTNLFQTTTCEAGATVLFLHMRSQSCAFEAQNF